MSGQLKVPRVQRFEVEITTTKKGMIWTEGTVRDVFNCLNSSMTKCTKVTELVNKPNPDRRKKKPASDVEDHNRYGAMRPRP